jgi:hypothetical protein
MSLSARIDPKYLLFSLNGKRDFGAELGPNALGSREGATELFLSELRALVDEWLDSGRSTLPGEGGKIEEPPKRNLENAPRAYEAMNGWLISERFSGLASTSGEITFTFGFKEMRPDGPIEDAAYKEACRIFVLLMQSPERYKLFKCADISCGYYLLDKPRKQYKRETHCAEHRHRVSALRGTRESRNRENEALFKTAVAAMKAWRKLSEREKAKKHKTEKEYIADEINLRHSKGGNWVTRNLGRLIREIDKELA